MTVARFLVGRLIALVVTLLLASFAVYGALFLAPGTPLAFLTRGRSMTPAQLQSIKAQYHLDEPFLAQYGHWLVGVLHGDFGISIMAKAPVSSLLGGRAVNTCALVACAALLILVVGLITGIVAGLRPGWVDSSLMLTATAAMAVPAFVAAIALIAVFAVRLGWFPVFGAGDSVPDRIKHLVLPCVALAFSSVAYVARLTRAAVREELGSDHVQTAVSRGIPQGRVIRRHVLRNAMIPIVTVAGLTIGGLIAGAVVIEQVFQLNGLGSYLVQAVGQKDFPVVQAICLILVAAFIVLNTIVDLAYSFLDPRIAVGKQHS
ncbi:ABC transporter permease [Angustibacter sp. McL0619]|uniref:ABC transporter permease n=1 Tax=Angustibacter sp. McL0619 TaxID=3415676 RepID=UPI003CE70C89